MSKPTFAERCQIAQQLLPYAQYRAMLTKLHAEMLAALVEQALDKKAENARELGLTYEPALTELLNNPEEHYPGNFDTPERANALLTGLCQDAAIEIKRLQDELLEQCRINGMSAEREDALRAEVERLNKALADEREACAVIGDSMDPLQDGAIGKAIRARSSI